MFSLLLPSLAACVRLRLGHVDVFHWAALCLVSRNTFLFLTRQCLAVEYPSRDYCLLLIRQLASNYTHQSQGHSPLSSYIFCVKKSNTFRIISSTTLPSIVTTSSLIIRNEASLICRFLSIYIKLHFFFDLHFSGFTGLQSSLTSVNSMPSSPSGLQQ